MLVRAPCPVTLILSTGIMPVEIVINSDPKIPDPSVAVAVAVIVPFITAVTKPEEFIVACPVPLTIDQERVLIVAFTGNTCAISWRDPFSVAMIVAPPVPETLITDTGVIWLEIVIFMDAKMPEPSFAVAQAVTVPLSIAVTSPVELMAPFPVPLTRDHVTPLFVAFSGRIVTLN
jgi:hypothetical protein